MVNEYYVRRIDKNRNMRIVLMNNQNIMFVICLPMKIGVHQKDYFQHSSKHISCHFSTFSTFSIGGSKHFTYFDFCQFFSHNII